MTTTHPPPEDYHVSTAMIKHGGGFVSLLGKAAQAADDDNLRKIKAAWPEYWAKYTGIANKARCPECGSFSVGKGHHAGTFALPECDYKWCEDCNHQWDHT